MMSGLENWFHKKKKMGEMKKFKLAFDEINQNIMFIREYILILHKWSHIDLCTFFCFL
jgi:hypothetical protein